MRPTLEVFKQLIETIEVYNQREEEMCDFLHKYFMDGHSIISFTSDYASALIKSIATSFANKIEDVEQIDYDIGYFVYESSFGKNSNEITVNVNNVKKTWVLDSIESFYKYLEDNYS